MIPLNVHSNYTLLKGTIPVEQLIDRAKSFNLNSLAITDTNGMYGAIQFAKHALASNIKPIIGCLIDEPGNLDIYAVLLAKNNIGYSNLCKIITSRKLNDDFSLKSLLSGIFPDLIIISPQIELLKFINKSNAVFVELITTKSQKNKNRERYQFVQQNNLKCVANNPVYFLNAEDYLLHKTVTAIGLNKNISDLNIIDLVDEEFYFKDPRKIEKEWSRLREVLSQSEIIAKDCNLNLHLDEYKYPRFDAGPDQSTEALLWQEAYKGLNQRYNIITEKNQKRLDDELAVIKEMSFTDYFLIVWDIVREAKRRGMMIIGRGSAANSLVAYCLGLTQVDPIELNLYFERFMNKARSSPPDVDIDFSWKERDEIIKYIFEKYGYENVAMISTTVTFRARSAFREVAKAFGISNEEISTFSKRIPWTNASNLPRLAELFPESKQLNFKIEPWKSIVDLASRIANFPRHLSIHPGGIVITPTKITDYVALEYAKNKGLGLIVTQPDMYSIEELGLIKIDILSQRSLGVLRDTMETIKK